MSTINLRSAWVNTVNSSATNGTYIIRNEDIYWPPNPTTPKAFGHASIVRHPVATFLGRQLVPIFLHGMYHNNGAMAQYPISSSGVFWLNGTTGSLNAFSTFASNISIQSQIPNFTQFDWFEVSSPIDIPSMNVTLSNQVGHEYYVSPKVNLALRNNVAGVNPFTNMSNPYAIGSTYTLPNNIIPKFWVSISKPYLQPTPSQYLLEYNYNIEIGSTQTSMEFFINAETNRLELMRWNTQILDSNTGNLRTDWVRFTKIR